MNKKIKAIIYGEQNECRAVGETLKGLMLLTDYRHEHCYVDDLEEFEKLLVDWEPTLLIVLANGAIGQESVYRAGQRLPNLPVFWFSDDREFSMQSYRLGCAYFSTKPVTQEKIEHAIHRCKHIGIQYSAT